MQCKPSESKRLLNASSVCRLEESFDGYRRGAEDGGDIDATPADDSAS